MKLRRIWQKAHDVSPFGSRVLLTSGTNVLLGLLGLVTGILAARLLGPEGRGELAAIQVWPTFIATVSMIGLPEAVVYFSAREPNRAGHYLGSAMTLGLLASVPFMAVGYLAMPAFLSAQSPDIVAAAQWYLLLVPINALVGTLFHPLRGRNDFAAWNGLRITPAIAWLVVLVIASVVSHADPQFVAAGYLVALALLFLPVGYTILRRVPGPFWPELQKYGAMLRYGLPSMAGSVPQMLNFRLDQMLMVAFLPSRMLGLYVVAVAWSNAIHPLLNALGAVVFPRVASQESREEQARAFAQGARLAVLVSLAITMTLMLLTPWMLPVLFGADFSAAIPAAVVLVIAAAVAGLNMVLEEGLRGLGRPTSVMWAEFGGLAVTAMALFLLLPSLKIVGAAIASLLGYTTVGVLLIAQARRLTGYSAGILLCPTVVELASGWRRVKLLIEAVAK